MNRWHQHYLRGDYHNQAPKALYQARLATVQEALDLIEDGDCLAWSTPGSEPKVFLEHLHTIDVYKRQRSSVRALPTLLSIRRQAYTCLLYTSVGRRLHHAHLWALPDGH